MFNFKKHKIAADLSQKISPQTIPGRTLDEKVAYISEYLDRSIGEQFANGQISEAEVYQLVADKAIETEEKFSFLEQYRSNIERLRKLAGDLLRAEGATQPEDEIIDKIITKLLARTNSVFIPQLIKLHRVKSRTYELVEPLLSYEKPEEIATIRNFISSEVTLRRNEIREEFVNIFKDLGLPYELSKEQMSFIFDNNMEEIQKLGLNDEQLATINKRIKDLKQKTVMMSSNQRIWNRILEMHSTIPDREKWESLIPESLRITWSLDSILRYYEFPIGVKSRVERKISTEKDKQASEFDSYFFPETDEYGNPLNDPISQRQYALSKLKICVLNGYDDEKIFDAIGLRRIARGPAAIGRKKKTEIVDEEVKEPGQDEEDAELIEEPEEIREPYGRRIKHWFNNFVTIETGKTAVSATTQLAAFRKDLRDAGLSGTAEILGQAYEKAEDNRYQDFDLKFLSAEEMNICNVLRNDYKLDPIPFPVKIPCPLDNPTSSNRFEIDFLLPCDVLVGFELVEGVNKNTGEITFINKPIIEHRVMFIGEYFGIRWTTPHPIEDNGREWCTPSGNVPVFNYTSAKAKIKQVIISVGRFCRDLEFYKLKSSWKIFTTEIIGDLVGTRTLSFDRQDLIYTSRLMKKLDAQGIIYKHKDCASKKDTCWAFKQIVENADNVDDYDMYFNDDMINERFDNIRERSLNIIDCAIVNVLLSEGLFLAKDTYTDPNGRGFNRQTMREHQQIYGTIDSNVEYLQSIGFKNEENLQGLRQFERKLAESSAKTRKQEQFDMANQMREDIRTFKKSPLQGFKDHFDKITSTGVIGEKIKNLRELRRLVESGKISPNFNELRSMIQSISPELLGQLKERGEGED